MRKQILVFCLLVFAISAAFGDDDACGPNKVKVIDARVHQRGNIYSPGYERNLNYPDFVRCTYQINGFHNMFIRLKFNEFDVEVSDFCQSDSLAVYDFDSQGRGVMKYTLCGKNNPRDMVSTGHVIQLIFNTNAFNTKRGFNITYWIVSTKDLCPSGYLECRNRNCVARNLKCNGKDECGDGSDEENCGQPIGVQDCGNPVISPLSGTDRIVGGKEVTPGSWPWMADLQLAFSEPNGHICGGTLINAQWVLTAAHCFGDYRTASHWRVHLGNHDKYEMDPYEQVRYVTRIIVYDDIPTDEFESNGQFDIVNDITLMKLNAPVNITSYVRPACLPASGKELALLTPCYATGWGMTRGTGSADSLKQALHPIQPATICQRRVGNQFHSPTMICAGLLQPQNGVCHGDSGGPLVCKTDKKWYVFGVASYVTDTNFIDGLCGLKQQPSVFNKVSAKISWISRMISKYT